MVHQLPVRADPEGFLDVDHDQCGSAHDSIVARGRRTAEGLIGAGTGPIWSAPRDRTNSDRSELFQTPVWRAYRAQVCFYND
jgi:hypothetical protein